MCGDPKYIFFISLLLLLLLLLLLFCSFQLTLNRKVEISGVTVFGIDCQSKSVIFRLNYKTGDSYEVTKV